MTTVTAASEITDGPVLTLINKRIRNLRKKLNRITQLEQQSLSQGKSAIKNKEQEDLLKSKPSIVAAVDELEKFRLPLAVAVDEEINLAIQHSHVTPSENKNDVDAETVTETLKIEGTETVPVPVQVPSLQSVELVEDLLSLIYFGSMFDVKSRSDFDSIMLTRTHERNCCLTYDYVTDDDSAVMLGESDLDLISSMGSLLISRPVNSSFSHQNELQRCIEHAKLWLAKSDQPIDSNSNVTYAALREKLAKIIGSDYLKRTPEMKATADVAAEAAVNYVFQVPVQVESSVTQHEQKENDASDFQGNETHEDQSGPVEDHSKVAGRFALINRNWHTNWLQLHRLYFDAFDADDFETGPIIMPCVCQNRLCRMFEAVREVLLRRPKPVLDFGVRAQSFRHNPLMNQTLLMLQRRSSEHLSRLSIDCMRSLYCVPKTFHAFRHLTELAFDYCVFSEPFVDFPILERLSLTHCQMSNANLVQSLRVCPNLKRVSLLDFIVDGDDDQIPIQEFVNSVCRAHYLALPFCLIKGFSWEVLPHTPEGSNLEELYIDAHEAEAENSMETPAQTDPIEQQTGGPDYKEQYVPRRSYQNQRGGSNGGRNNGGVGGGRRGFGNGRGGRSGGRSGPYQNGRNQYNDQPGNYYPRNYHGGRGRGGRGGGSYAYNNNGTGVEVAES